MKTVLDICGVAFVAKNASTAAKVADLLGQMQPVSREYLHEPGLVLVAGHVRRADTISLTQLGSTKIWTRAEYAKARVEQDKQKRGAE